LCNRYISYRSRLIQQAKHQLFLVEQGLLEQRARQGELAQKSYESAEPQDLWRSLLWKLIRQRPEIAQNQ
jgi:hypothetical protein